MLDKKRALEKIFTFVNEKVIVVQQDSLNQEVLTELEKRIKD